MQQQLSPQSDDKVPLAEQIDEVERELQMRDKVYHARVVEGKMTLNDAYEKKRRMQAVLDTLKWVQANRAVILEAAYLARQREKQAASSSEAVGQ